MKYTAEFLSSTWYYKILFPFQEHVTKDDARQQFLHTLRTLPYGFSVFFNVRKIDDPIGLLPGRIILGINKRGVRLKNDLMIIL